MITEAKWNEIGERIGHVGIALAADYAARGSQFESEELEQQMWLELMERKDDPELMARPVNQIVNLVAWRTKNWINRGEIKYTNCTGGRIQIESSDFHAVVAHNPWHDVDDNLDQPWLEATINEMITSLGGTTEIVARNLMTGLTKAETARKMGLDRATIQYHKNKLSRVFSQMGAC